MKKNLKLIRAYIADNWKFTIPIVLGLGLLGLLLTFKLGSLVGGLANFEYVNKLHVATNSIGLSTVVREPVFLPYEAMLYFLQLTPFGGPAAIRVIGVIFGALSVLAMFYIFKKWYTTRIAILGSVLYATTSWFLHTSRLAEPSATYLLLPLLAAVIIALQSKPRSRFTVTLAVIFGFSTLYIPGVIWFLLPAVIIKRKVILRALRLQPIWYKTIIVLLSLVMLVPLTLGIIKPIPGEHTALENLQLLAGLPSEGIHSLSTIASNAWHRIADIFLYNTAGPLYAPGHLAWFDIATSLLVLLGAIQFIIHWRLDRSKLLAVIGGVSLVLIALGGPVNNVILLPFLFLIAVEGLKWLLDTWLGVFPRNPFARSFAVGIIVLLVGTIGTYQLNKYFNAWAKSPETRQVFNQRP